MEALWTKYTGSVKVHHHYPNEKVRPIPTVEWCLLPKPCADSKEGKVSGGALFERKREKLKIARNVFLWKFTLRGY